MQEVVKNEIIKWLDVGVIYPIAGRSWVCHDQCVPKKRGETVVSIEKKELINICPVTGWGIYMDYQKLNTRKEKDNFTMPFMD